MKMTTDQATETKTRWERPKGWDGTWGDIFEEMGWDPADVQRVLCEPSVFESLVEYEVDIPYPVGVEVEDGELVYRAGVQLGYNLDSVGAIEFEDGELVLYPTKEAQKLIWEAEHYWERAYRKQRRAREKGEVVTKEDLFKLMYK